MTKWKILGLTFGVAMLATNSGAQDAALRARPDNKVAVVKDGSANGSPTNLVVNAATDDPKYVIGPEDELIISVWKEPDISRTVPVRPDGKISLALLNDVQATGRTPMQLGSDIAEKLKSFISEPQVTVIVSKINSQRIFIVGEILRPGAYTLLPSMTALDAISDAGGFSPFAKRTKIFILRKENEKVTRIPFNYKEALHSRRPEQDVVLKPGDRIVVP